MTDTATKTDAPKAPKAAAKKPAKATVSDQTIRERVFRLLAKKPMTGGQVKESLGLGGIPSLLKDEGVSDKPRIRRKAQEGVRGVVYELTAAGKKDLDAGKVDENAAPPSGGKEWPAGK